MKKFISFVAIVLVLLIGASTMEAKTTKKGSRKGGSTSSVVVQKDEDGDPIIFGHTYRIYNQGVRTDFTFGYGQCELLLRKGNYEELYGMPYDYDGKNVVIGNDYDPDNSFYGVVSPDGKSIKLATGYTLKIVK